MAIRHDNAACTATTRQAARLTLAAVPKAASCSREFVRYVLGQWRLAHFAETAELLTSELVTNAVEATSASAASSGHAVVDETRLAMIDVQIVLAGCLFVGVWDRDTRPPVPQEQDSYAESGRGIFLVDCLSKGWGYYHPPRTGGKTIWYQLGCVGDGPST